MDLRKIRCEEGGQTVTVGVPDHQQLRRVRMGGLQYRQGLVAPQEKGVFVLLLQLGPVIKHALLGLCPGPSRGCDSLLRHIDVDGIGLHPAHTGGRKGRAVEIRGHRRPLIAVQRRRRQPHGVHQSSVAVVGPQTGPVVVQTIVDLLSGVGPEHGGDIHPIGLRGRLRLAEDRVFIGVGRARREPVRPQGYLPRDQGKVHRDLHIFHQLVHIIQVIRNSFFVRPVKARDKGIRRAQIDAVVLPFSQGPLGNGLGGDPAVPAHKLVGDILLKLGHERAGKKVAAVPEGQAHPEVLRRQRGSLGQVAVFLRGKRPVRRDEVGGEEHPQKSTEQHSQKNGISFGHGSSPP